MFDYGEGNDFSASYREIQKTARSLRNRNTTVQTFLRFDRFERVCFVIRASLIFASICKELLQRSPVLFEIKIKQRLFVLTLYTSVL